MLTITMYTNGFQITFTEHRRPRVTAISVNIIGQCSPGRLRKVILHTHEVLKHLCTALTRVDIDQVPRISDDTNIEFAREWCIHPLEWGYASEWLVQLNKGNVRSTVPRGLNISSCCGNPWTTSELDIIGITHVRLA